MWVENAGFCDSVATLNACICFAAITTRSRQWQRPRKGGKSKNGKRYKLLVWYCKKKKWLYHLKANTWHIKCHYGKEGNCTYCRCIYQHQLCLFVFPLQVSVILAQRHNRLVHTPGDVLHFKARLDIYRQARASLKQYKVHWWGKKKKNVNKSPYPHQKSYLFRCRL